MLQLILAGVGFSLWVLYTIITYYSTNYSAINHREDATGYLGYLISIIVLYAGYKLYSIFFSGKRVIKYNFFHIFFFSLLQLLILAIAYTSATGMQLSQLFAGARPSSMMLFFHSVSLLIYPILLVVILRSLGSTILSRYIESWEGEKLRLKFPVETVIGFFIFSTALLALGAVSYYNLTGLLILLGIILAVSIPGLKQTYKDIRYTSASFDNHNLTGGPIALFAPRLLSVEFAFILVSFLIGVSLINAIRPMPIGWDDLGAYMNFPKIMALSGEYILGAGMYAWQMITGTGYLFSYTAAQAFYVNQLGGILAVIVITAGLSLIFEEKNKKYLLSLPLILAAVFYATPMNIFQQAKDMKLDPALLFISISAFLLLFSAWREGLSAKKSLSFIALAGIITGFAFSVKFTTLMLILGGLGFIAYRKLSISGFFGFFFLFLATFTQLGLWKIMNVWMPTDRPAMMSAAVIILTILGILSLVIAYTQFKKEAFIQMLYGVLTFIVGIVIGLSPWLVKNISETKPWELPSGDKAVVINAILGGSGGNFTADFSKIYTEQEYKQRQNAEKNASITSDGKSQNEDFGRYFGYEKGLNNYLKLPANLTFQKNQPGEFTEITYIFLAFIPAILLFVRGRRGLYAGGIAILLSGMYLYYFNETTTEKLSEFFGNYELPLGYLIILIFNIIFLLASHFGIEKNETNTKLKEIIITLGVYGFLFWISAFGIVWYGILVYFLFLTLIGLAAMNFVTYDEVDEKDADLLSVKVTLTLIFVIFILTYFVRSALPHGWNNLKEASYNEFKYNVLNQEESIFAYRQDYITPIATLNVVDLDKLMTDVKAQASSMELKELFASDKLTGISIREFAYVLFSLSNTKNKAVATDAKKLGNILYKSILYPNKSIRNEGGIYRIGTFMTYLIDRNRQRFFDDSLVFSFETYFYDKSPEITIDRMKKIGIKYLLVDLNAATIDKDPRHALTNRFEHLLHTMKARNLKLVDTDNMCLRFAIDKYKLGELQNDDEFIGIAGTNYESYLTQSGSEEVISRNQKQGKCYNLILKTISTEEIDTRFPYLVPIKEAIVAEKAFGTDALSQQKLVKIFSQFFTQSWFALFEIYDAPKLAEPTLTTTPEITSQTGSVTLPADTPIEQ